MMKRVPRLTINLLATWGDYATGALICLILMPFVLHTLGDTTYGLWLFINSIAGYSGLLNLGFGETISRYVAAHHARNETHRMNQVVNVIGAVYLAMGAVAIAAALGLAWAAPWLGDWSGASLVEIRWVFVILGINTAVGIVGSVFGGVLVGIQRFDLERGMIFVSGVARFYLTIFLLSQRHALLTLALIFLTVTTIENVGYVYFAFRKVPGLSFGRRYLSWPVLKECFSFSGFAFLHNVSQRVIWATDNIVIGFVLGAEAIVPYFIAARLCEFISKPVTCVGMVMMPRAGELHAHEKTRMLQSLLTKGLGFAFLLMMGFFIGAGFFGKAVIETWVGAGYDESHLLLLVLLGARIVSTPMEVVRAVMFGMARVRVPALLYALEALANLGLTLVLIRPFGLMGVAWGTAVPLIAVELGLLLPYALKQLGCEPRRLLREAIAPQLLPLAALLAYSVLVSRRVTGRGWPLLFAIAAAGGAVLAVVWLAQQIVWRRWGSQEDTVPEML
ncbi:MAG: lipopolysaccharide biosynthesis protein [Planctomycetes bacterium]|nr:lipopolysaccharide biosynthesis protein [Planctomycetota bacterium]